MIAPVGTRRSIGSGKAHVPVVSYAVAFIRSTFGISLGVGPTTLARAGGKFFGSRNAVRSTHVNSTRPASARDQARLTRRIGTAAAATMTRRRRRRDGSGNTRRERREKSAHWLAGSDRSSTRRSAALVTRRRTAPTSRRRRRRRRRRHRRQGDGARRAPLSRARRLAPSRSLESRGWLPAAREFRARAATST